MIVGTIDAELLIPGSASLKDKRRVLRSLLDRIRARFNVSTAELDFHDKWQRTRIGIAFVCARPGDVGRIAEALKDMLYAGTDFTVSRVIDSFCATDEE